MQIFLDESSTLFETIEITAISIYFSLSQPRLDEGIREVLQHLLKQSCEKRSIHSIITNLSSTILNATISRNNTDEYLIVIKTGIKYIKLFITALLAGIILIRKISDEKQVRNDMDQLHLHLEAFHIQSEEAAVALRKNFPIIKQVYHEVESTVSSDESQLRLMIADIVDILQLLQSVNEEFLRRAERYDILTQTNIWTRLLRLTETKSSQEVQPRVNNTPNSFLSIVGEAFAKVSEY